MHLVCECKTVYAVGAKACPSCGSTKATPDHPMPGYVVVDGELVPLATGGVIEGDMPIVGDKGPETVVPLAEAEPAE